MEANIKKLANNGAFVNKQAVKNKLPFDNTEVKMMRVSKGIGDFKYIPVKVLTIVADKKAQKKNLLKLS